MGDPGPPSEIPPPRGGPSDEVPLFLFFADMALLMAGTQGKSRGEGWAGDQRNNRGG